MRDTLLSTLAAVLVMAFIATMIIGSVAIGKRWHAAEACMEDEVFAPVHYATQGAFTDSHGVTRMCVNIDELN